MPKATRSGPLAAYVLHRYDWSETSLILDLFTRSKGRIAVAAKGAKRPYSQLRSVLLPFQRITVSLGKAVLHEEGALRRISASIIVEREAHKGMVIGDKGERLKRIGTDARIELERLMDSKVFLELWVKVRSGWADSEEHLRSYGYE